MREIESIISRAFEIDKRLPSVKPHTSGSLLSGQIVIPDTERSLEDLLEDERHSRLGLTNEDIKLWYKVMSDVLPKLPLKEGQVVKLRMYHISWKRISRKLKEHGVIQRELTRQHLWRIYSKGLDNAEKIYFG